MPYIGYKGKKTAALSPGGSLVETRSLKAPSLPLFLLQSHAPDRSPKLAPRCCKKRAQMFKLSDGIGNFLTNALVNWWVEMIANRISVEIKLLRGIFLGDSLSSLLFVIAIMRFNHYEGNVQRCYNCSKSQKKINQFTYMNAIKVSAKKKKKKKRTRDPNTNNKNIQSRMEFGIWNCTILIMKNEKSESAGRIEQPNPERTGTFVW